MSTAKHYLKLAKGAIDKNDPELALEYVQDVLEADKNNFFAFLFQGKSYQLINDTDQAIKAFQKATQLQPDNLLGWKGYFQVVSESGVHELFFQVLAQYLQVEAEQGQGLGQTLRNASNYIKKHNLKGKPDLHELFLSHVIPGTKLHELAPSYFGRDEDNLQKLVDLVFKKENELVVKACFKERMKFPKQLSYDQQDLMNNIIWPIYKNSKLSDYFDEFLNICNDDDKRKKYQELYFQYKYDVLKVSPKKSKSKILQQVKDMCDDLILLNIPSHFVWSKYFDLLDVKDFRDLDKDQVIFCIKNFQAEGLGILFYGLVHSEISPFNRDEISKEVKIETETEVEEDEDQDLINLMETKDDGPSRFSAEQILELIKEGSSKLDSVFSKRILIDYYLHMREYLGASDICRVGIKLLADMQHAIGVDLVNSRASVVCSLAVVYTYHEAPKNYSRALELYERILELDKHNKRARIGKGLILLEKGNLSVAKKLLTQAFNDFPDDSDVLMELGWCEVQLGNHQVGRTHLEKSLKSLTGLDIQSCELRASINWRIARSYILEKPDNVDVPYQLLIKSLKEYNSFAPSYTALGIIYFEVYGDKVRAQKCFYKAFELDIAEVESAKYLVTDMTSKKEWEVAEILCSKIVDTERARKALSSQQDKSWPYRVLGCSALNKQDDAKAIQWFQTALRMASMDFECWVGLGEAYYNCGRFDAAQKVFERALTLKEEESWQITYMLGKVLCDTKEFDDGIEKLERALELRPGEECVVNALFQAKIEQIQKLLPNGYFGRVLDINRNVLELVKQCSKINKKTQSLWLGLYHCLSVYLKIQSNLEDFPLAEVEDIFNEFKDETFTEPFLQELNQIDDNINLQGCSDIFRNGKHVEGITSLIIFNFKVCIHLLPEQGRYMRSINYYNLGLAYYEAFNHCEKENLRTAAIKCFKKAVVLEGKNSSFWIALGNAYSSFSPQISQHCFIKATALESRDGDIWNNLAALYLKYGDVELAQQAFLRSQSVAPEQSQAWLGHALASKASADVEKAHSLFNHAYILSNGRSPLAQLLYALSIISKRVGNNSSPEDIETAQDFSIANFAIQNYLKFYPKDKMGLKVALTISERCKTFDLSKDIGQRLLVILEAEYEETESPQILQEFVNTKVQVARIHLALGDYAQAVQESEMVLGLIDETDALDINKRNLLSARITIGLAHFFDKDLEKSVEQLKAILVEYSQYEWLVTLTAQMLNAFNSPDTKQAALDQLFSFIEDSDTESSLIIVLTLGAIALKDGLEDILPAVKDELHGLSLTQIVGDTHKYVPKIIQEISSRLGQSHESKIWERTAILFPQDFNVWKNINSQLALQIANLQETKLTSLDMSDALVAYGRFRDVQRSIVLAPHNANAWASFYSVSSPK
ncbi:Superkiller protein 3 [Yamadazyma tenuis]|uniref:Protein prenylyltransferase n=1 Tax=Candida tenuis (strain ATCC 10573 / BCRC 21748 / CBS 615 / JCM 9827 / NBRC 10315 / NRRL Y-1498 / VKM Y-70) TaxID=590646 RepID=G3AZW0_CANTC|nr:protein prenylyltransferase [Yamadazyma tenuis ATCC 10573]EGV65252.1 protein prenylyltransferase [Yamadazyma tenuis ATCC 10573]WEJ95092.1 Superkiller protein 3 [Yamadazyma tenuis]